MERITYARRCDITNQGMNEGWCFGDGEQYAATEDAALSIAKSLGYESLQAAYDDDAVYWTEWEDEDDHQYEVVDGTLVEID